MTRRPRHTHTHYNARYQKISHYSCENEPKIASSLFFSGKKKKEKNKSVDATEMLNLFANKHFSTTFVFGIIKMRLNLSLASEIASLFSGGALNRVKWKTWKLVTQIQIIASNQPLSNAAIMNILHSFFPSFPSFALALHDEITKGF